MAKFAGANALGIVMTGMGDDGARGLLEIHNAGARRSLGQASCVVFGMPMEAIKLGAAELHHAARPDSRAAMVSSSAPASQRRIMMDVQSILDTVAADAAAAISFSPRTPRLPCASSACLTIPIAESTHLASLYLRTAALRPRPRNGQLNCL